MTSDEDDEDPKEAVQITRHVKLNTSVLFVELIVLSLQLRVTAYAHILPPSAPDQKPGTGQQSPGAVQCNHLPGLPDSVRSEGKPGGGCPTHGLAINTTGHSMGYDKEPTSFQLGTPED